MPNSISEKIIEDILDNDPSILAEILGITPTGLSLIARQKSLTSGKLDLLYLYENELLLIELKAVDFYNEIIEQINNYFGDLVGLQSQNKLIGANIRRIILVTDYLYLDKVKCDEQGIELFAYKPEQVLSKYYENFRELSSFIKIQSGDYGVVRLGLLKSALHLLSSGKTLKQICALEGKSIKTIHNRLSIAERLGLINKYRNEIFLTELGTQFIDLEELPHNDRLNEAQKGLLSDFVKNNPFFSSVTYTILAAVESVFVLSKNTFPVPFEGVQNYFVMSVGKSHTWKTPKARQTATYIFTNYGCELEFLTKINNTFYITPKGIQSILLLQLNRSIKLIEARV